MLGRENETVDVPITRSVCNASVICATPKSVMEFLRKKNAPPRLMAFAQLAVVKASEIADRLRNTELTPEELSRRAEDVQAFSAQAKALKTAELTAHQVPSQLLPTPLPEPYFKVEELVKAAEEYKPGPRRILMPSKGEEPCDADTSSPPA